MDADLRFDGKVVIVTGAAAGMGRSHAAFFARRGALVVANDVHDADAAARELSLDGGTVIADSHDIGSEDGAAAVVTAATESFGRVDVLVNNAGISVHRPFSQVDTELLAHTLKVNLIGPFFLTQRAWPHLCASAAGRVVMVASESAVRGLPNLAHYAASKGALLALTRALAAEGAAQGVAVNAVNPTAFTQMSSMQARIRLARSLGLEGPDDPRLAERSSAVVSALVGWLCHPDCEANGEFFKVEAPKVARFTYCQSAGIPGRDITAELIRDRFDSILDMREASVPPTWRTLPSSE